MYAEWQASMVYLYITIQQDLPSIHNLSYLIYVRLHDPSTLRKHTGTPSTQRKAPTSPTTAR